MDKLRKTSNIPPTTLSASISDTDTTIPLSSTVGAETSTCIDIVIDRIDAAGEKTPDKMEVVTVLISGNNGTNAARGRTAPAMPHEQGAVVEYNISTSVLHNDLVDGMLENLTTEGKLKDKLSLASKKKGALVAKGDGTSEFNKVTPDMISLEPSTDANGWMVYNYGGLRLALKTVNKTQVCNQHSTIQVEASYPAGCSKDLVKFVSISLGNGDYADFVGHGRHELHDGKIVQKMTALHPASNVTYTLPVRFAVLY